MVDVFSFYLDMKNKTNPIKRLNSRRRQRSKLKSIRLLKITTPLQREHGVQR